MNEQPIGIFDSGVGGTTVWKEIHQRLPNENAVYLADSKNAPYGKKTQSEIVALSIKNTDILLNIGVKMIVVACNTATTNAISVLRNRYTIPFVGVEPAIKPAALHTKSKNIGLLATRGTIDSELLHKTAKNHTQDVNVIEVVGEGLVELIEEDKINSDETRTLLKKYLEPMLRANVDTLVLGCTHYPYLKSEIEKIIPKNVSILDSGAAIAKRVESVLKENKLKNTSTAIGKQQFFINKNTTTLNHLLSDYPEALITQTDF